MFNELPFETYYSLGEMKQYIIEVVYSAIIYNYEGLIRISVVIKKIITSIILSFFTKIILVEMFFC